MALLDPSCHLTLDIIGEDAMGGFASAVLAKSTGSTDLKLGTDWFVLELWDQVNILPKDLGIAFISAELPVGLILSLVMALLSLGLLPPPGFLSSVRFALAIIFATIIALFVNELMNDGGDGNNEVFAVKQDLVQVTFKVNCFPVKGLHI